MPPPLADRHACDAGNRQQAVPVVKTVMLTHIDYIRITSLGECGGRTAAQLLFKLTLAECACKGHAPAQGRRPFCKCECHDNKKKTETAKEVSDIEHHAIGKPTHLPALLAELSPISSSLLAHLLPLTLRQFLAEGVERIPHLVGQLPCPQAEVAIRCGAEPALPPREQERMCRQRWLGIKVPEAGEGSSFAVACFAHFAVAVGDPWRRLVNVASGRSEVHDSISARPERLQVVVLHVVVFHVVVLQVSERGRGRDRERRGRGGGKGEGEESEEVRMHARTRGDTQPTGQADIQGGTDLHVHVVWH